MIFNNWLERDNCYNNYMYKNVEMEQVPEFDGYNIPTRLYMIYKYTIEYSNLLFSSKCDRLLVANLTKNPKIRAEQNLAYKTVLNNFAQWI